MKKLLSIVFIFITVYITSASGADTKNVTAKLFLGVPKYEDSGYEYKPLRTLDVSIQDGDCTFDKSNLPFQSTYTDTKHISIGAIDLNNLQGNSINKDISLICKETATQLRLQFSFTYPDGNVDTEEQITIREFSIKKPIDNNSALFNDTVPTSYQEQEIITKAAANLCSGGNYKQTKNLLCCINGFFDTNDLEVKEAYYSLKAHGITPSICPTDTGTMNVSGTVVDETTNEPLPYANIAILDNPSKGTATDENGNFTLSDVPLDTKLKILFVGYKTKEIFPSRNITIKMTPTSTTLSEIKVTACGGDKENGIKSKTMIDGKCYPSACVEPRWTLDGTGKNSKCVAGELSESDSLAKIDELRDNATAMRDKERSTANKLLGAAGIGATGIGGMQMASAMAEENADADAERAMRAYLATFHCNYGNTKNIAGGERDIELPGGNELINLYSEYVNLANDLKTRKTALDMRPGIESESILDAATSGLYDDVAIGKTSGAYTSLARALMDPTGADAAAWAAQKEETADKKKTGMITAGIGAAGSLIGNLAINSGKDKQNKVDEILNKYDKKKQLLDELESNIAAIPPQIVPCPAGTTGEKLPDCTCPGNKKIFNPKTTTCEDCPGDLVVIDGKCKCPSDKPLSAPNSDKCYAMPQQCTPKCDLKSDSNLQVLLDCSCTCKNHFDYIDGECKCDGPNKQVVNGQCQTVTVETVTETKTIFKTEQIFEHVLTETETITGATLPTDSLFDLGKSTLRDEAKLHISNFINELSESGYTNCSIKIDGYTDPLGKPELNQTLSQQRANAVKEYISNLKPAIKRITATGHGEDYCTCGAGTAQNKQINYDNDEYNICRNKDAEFKLKDNARYAPCRRVVITPTCDKTTTTVTTR